MLSATQKQPRSDFVINKGKENYTKGSIHRWITIGTPHFGGPLSKFLYDRRDYWYLLYVLHIRESYLYAFMLLNNLKCLRSKYTN